jgi:hypothetical protein
MTEKGCDLCGSDSDECADGCRYQNGEEDDMPVPPVQSVPDAPAEAVLTVQVPPVSDPILDLLSQHEKALAATPGNDTAAFMAYMGAVNEAEFGKPGRGSIWRRPSFWVAAVAVATVALVWLVA